MIPHKPTRELLENLKGLEIGGTLDNAFNLNALNVCPERFKDSEGEGRCLIDIDAYGDDIPVEDNSQDFVFSSHVAEHMPNLIKALIEWNRVVRNNGYVVMIVPHRDARVLDRPKPLTSWNHILEDYELNHTVDTHPYDESIGDYLGGHYHVFTMLTFTAIIRRTCEMFNLNWELVSSEPQDSIHGNGFFLAYKIRK